MTPTRKITATGVSGAVAVVIVWALGLLGADVPAEVAAAIATICAFGAGYATSDR